MFKATHHGHFVTDEHEESRAHQGAKTITRT